jgi:hypothetical protein
LALLELNCGTHLNIAKFVHRLRMSSLTSLSFSVYGQKRYIGKMYLLSSMWPTPASEKRNEHYSVPLDKGQSLSKEKWFTNFMK